MSRQGFVVIFVGILLSVYVGEAEATSSVRAAGLWLLVALTGTAVSAAIIVVELRLPLYQNRRVTPLPLWFSVAIAFLAGLLVASLMGVMVRALDLSPTLSEPVRTLVTAFMGGFFGISLILFLDRWDRARTNLNLLAEQQVNTELAALSQAFLLRELRGELLVDLNNELESARQQVQDRLNELESAQDVQAFAEVSEEIRAIAEGAIRPLSARLWESAVQDVPRVRWWKVLAETVRRAPFYPLALVLFNVVGNLLSQLEIYGTAIGISLTVVTSIVVIVVFVPANWLLRRYPHRHAVIYLSALPLVEGMAIPLSFIRDSLVPGTGGVGWVVLQIVAGSLVVLVTSAVGSWWDMRDVALESHQRALTDEQVRVVTKSRAVADLVREASRLLHGSVQTRLVACAMNSERAIAQSDTDSLNSSLVEAARILSSIELDEPAASTLRQEVQRKIDLWQELCRISLQFDDRLAGDSSQRFVRLAGQIVEEAISNAVRHGDADEMWISMRLVDSGDLSIEVLDNGAGIASDIPGLGTALLVQATQGRWSLATTPAGTLLTATLSLHA